MQFSLIMDVLMYCEFEHDLSTVKCLFTSDFSLECEFNINNNTLKFSQGFSPQADNTGFTPSQSSQPQTYPKDFPRVGVTQVTVRARSRAGSDQRRG